MVYKKSGVKNKRWTLEANAKTAFGSGGFKLNTRSLTTAVEKIVRKDLETPQHWVLADSNNTVTGMTHNTIYTFNPLYAIPQGTDYARRIGDEIHVDAIKLSWIMQSRVMNSPTIVRILLVKSALQYATPTFGSGLGSTGLFIGGSGSAFMACGIIDPKIATVVWQKEFIMKPMTSTEADVSCVRETIKLDTKFVYKTNTGYSKNMNYYFVVVSSVFGGVPGTTATLDLFANSDVIFKNSK